MCRPYITNYALCGHRTAQTQNCSIYVAQRQTNLFSTCKRVAVSETVHDVCPKCKHGARFTPDTPSIPVSERISTLLSPIKEVSDDAIKAWDKGKLKAMKSLKSMVGSVKKKRKAPRLACHSQPDVANSPMPPAIPFEIEPDLHRSMTTTEGSSHLSEQFADEYRSLIGQHPSLRARDTTYVQWGPLLVDDHVVSEYEKWRSRRDAEGRDGRARVQEGYRVMGGDWEL